MVDPLTDQILHKIGEVHLLYYRLILVVGPEGSGKTSALRKLSTLTSRPLVNVGLELSRQLLDMTAHQRDRLTPRLLRATLDKATGDLVLLDNTEMLFDVQLRQDPLRLLQELSRNRTLVAAWNGSVIGKHITYAVPDHPGYRRYMIQDFLVVSPKIAK